MKTRHFIIVRVPIDGDSWYTGDSRHRFKFEDLVNAYIKAGYELHGTTRTVKGYYEQNMILPFGSDDKEVTHSDALAAAEKIFNKRLSEDKSDRHDDDWHDENVVDLSEIPF